MKRVTDLMLAATLLVLVSGPGLLIALLIKLTSKGPVIHWSVRVGARNCIFLMPKFRTMRVGTPEVATCLLDSAQQWFTPVGNLLRSSSLDELPQLWSILRGHMSFVGPRPVLPSERELLRRRTQAGVARLVPGLTGWAQINGRDTLGARQKVELERHYLERQSFWLDIRIILLTLPKVLRREDVADTHPQSVAAEQPNSWRRAA